MRRSLFIYLIGILVALTNFFLPIAYAGPELSPLESDTQKDTLPNGLSLIIREDNCTPTFALSLYIRVGSAAEGEYTGSGISHFIEHMIFKGTTNRDAIQLESQIKSLGAVVGAYTSFDYTAFKMEGPSDNILPLLDIFYDIIANPKFDKEEFAKEKNVIKTEAQLAKDDPRQYLSREFWQTIYLVHPYRNPVIGYEAIFDNLTPEDLRRYYDKFYIPDNMVLVIVGDIDAAQVKEKASSTLGQLKRRPFNIPVMPPEPPQAAPRYKELPYAISKGYMMLGFHSVALTSRDLYALDTLAILLGEGNSSILYRRLHNELKLVYEINAYNYTPFNPGVFVVSATFEPNRKDEIVNEVLEQIEDIKKSTTEGKELEKAKNQVMSSYIFNKQTQRAQADDLGTNQLLTGEIDFSRRYVEGIGLVTSEDIRRVAKRYLTKENMAIALLYPSTIEAVEAKVSTKSPAVRNVVERDLKNGTRVLICEDRRLPLVSLRVTVGGGLRAEDEATNGISNLTALMLPKGAASRSEEDIFSTVESLGGNLSAYSGNNSFGLSLDIMSKDIKKGLELLGDILLHPTFPDNKLRLLKKDILAQISLINDDIFAATEKRLRKGLFPKHPYGMLSIGDPASVEKISRRDIVDFYRKYCVGPNIVISVCGDIDTEEIYSLIAANFSGAKKRNPPQIKQITLGDIKSGEDIREKMAKEQAVVMIGFRSAGLQNPDRYPLQILSSLFSGGAGRLYTNIRHAKGMAYTLGTFGMTGVDTGTFIFYAATSAANLDTVKNDIISEIKKVCEGNITQEEIEAAKKALISGQQMELQTAGALALQTALDELYGLGFDNYLRVPQRINNVSREEVIQMANKYFNPQNSATSITTPAEE